MAEVANGSVNEPHQTPPTPEQEGSNDAGADAPVKPEGLQTVEVPKSPLPEESERKTVETGDSEEPNSSQPQPESDEHQQPESTEPTEDTEDTSPQHVEEPPESDPDQKSPHAEPTNEDGSTEAGEPTSQVDDGSVAPQDEPSQDSRMRSDSRSTTATVTGQRSGPVSSTVFIITSLDTIGASKEARKNKELEDTVKAALSNVKQSERQPIDPEVIFRPLYLATKSFSIPLQVTALDCIGKLITYSYFAFPSAKETEAAQNETSPEQTPLIERAIDAICGCFENEATPIEIQQQIIKSLLAAVLNDKIVVHGAGLLKAVRQIYNIFIYSKSTQNQQIAQGSLTQMVSTVFDRVRMRLDLKEARVRVSAQGATSDVGSIDPSDTSPSNDQDQASDTASAVTFDQPVIKEPAEKLTLQSFESSKDVASVNENAPTMVTRAKLNRKRASRSISGAPEDEKDDPDGAAEDEEDEIYIKDAFLVFRALCKLSHRVLNHDQQQDLKSQNMRTKLLSLHLIHYLINNQVPVFVSPLVVIKNGTSTSDAMTLLQAVRPHLCLSLSRNGSSSVPRVFYVCCEIFWLMLKHMRVMMKVRCFPFFFFFFFSMKTEQSSNFRAERTRGVYEGDLFGYPRKAKLARLPKAILHGDSGKINRRSASVGGDLP